ncbi:DNA-binding transcriptional LysR family regulator [Pararhizobium capsulatum DSM 1112]|uniref:DNA-binding transcriptional LysR family regulator n=1 Tax=Pararhizobium capsulatum DSM 1112 TaxID=1121113 RepID=A0ABU0C177_9HYPH|nr:LysR family transcriptional regulator [Pararhizobium capsulatum]MDQ0323646.1 DNA-binding transcriptional LysR family regulator [Pararhizobium capsulatum DSM 1112]
MTPDAIVAPVMRKVPSANPQIHRRFGKANLQFCKSACMNLDVKRINHLSQELAMDDWNDLRLVLAVARAGSLTKAAELLRVNHSTAFRRLRHLEDGMGVRLFERLPGGTYRPTAAGERVSAAGERIETEAATIARDIAGRDLSLTGRLRVTSSETLAYRLLTPAIGRFRDAHPDIMIELAIDNRVLSLSRREADLALRVTRPREGDLYGRKLSDIAWTVYARRDLAAKVGVGPDKITQLPIIGWEESMSDVNAAEWISSHVPNVNIGYRTNSVVNQLVAVRAGIGAAVLPCYLGDPEPDLVRIIDPVPELVRELWIVTHTDLKNTARIRAFFDIVGEDLLEKKALLAGIRVE